MGKGLSRYSRFKQKLQDFFGEDCHFCDEKAVVKCTTHGGEYMFLCSTCLRGFRFDYERLFQSVKPYGSYKGHKYHE